MADHGWLLLDKRAMASLCWALLAIVSHVVRMAKSRKWMTWEEKTERVEDSKTHSKTWELRD